MAMITQPTRRDRCPAMTGSIVRTEGLAAAVAGFPAPVGALVEIERQAGGPVEAEVIGFRDRTTLVYPLGEMTGVRHGNRVRLTRTSRTMRVGPELLGPRDRRPRTHDRPPAAARAARANAALAHAAAGDRSAADRRAAFDRRARDRRPADLRPGAADRHLFRLGRGQERDAGHDGPLHVGRRERDRADRRARPRGQRLSGARPGPSRPGAQRRGRRDERPAGSGARAGGDDRHVRRRVFSRSGQERAPDHGFAHAVCHGPARDRPGRRRAADDPRLSAERVCPAAAAGRAGRPRQPRQHHGVLFGARRRG